MDTLPERTPPASARCIRFAPPEIEGAALAHWRERYVPRQWRAPQHHILFGRAGAADLNDRYGEMLDVLATSPCPYLREAVLDGVAKRKAVTLEEMRSMTKHIAERNDRERQINQEDAGGPPDLLTKLR
jgi:hypothetical protein